MSEEEEAGQPQRYCGNCGVEVRPGNSFCAACGEPLTPETEAPKDTPAEPLSESLPGAGGRGDEERSGPDEGGVIKEGGLRKSPREIRLEYDLYRGFFEEARDRLARFSERLKDGVDEPDHGSPIAHDVLAQALLHAQKGLDKTEEYKETLTGLFRDESHQEKAISVLDELRRVQDEVLASLQHLYDNLEAAEGRTQFEEEFARWYPEDLEPHLRRGSARQEHEQGHSASSPSPLGSFDDYTRAMPGRVLRWVDGLPYAQKVWVVIAALVLLVVLSPLTLLVAGLVFGASVIVLIGRVRQRRPVKGWGIVAVTSFVFIFVFAGISSALYSTGFTGGTDSSPGKAARSSPSGATSTPNYYIAESERIDSKDNTGVVKRGLLLVIFSDSLYLEDLKAIAEDLIKTQKADSVAAIVFDSNEAVYNSAGPAAAKPRNPRLSPLNLKPGVIHINFSMEKGPGAVKKGYYLVSGVCDSSTKELQDCSYEYPIK